MYIIETIKTIQSIILNAKTKDIKDKPIRIKKQYELYVLSTKPIRDMQAKKRKNMNHIIKYQLNSYIGHCYPTFPRQPFYCSRNKIQYI